METTRLTVTTEEAGQRADSLMARRLEGLTRSAAARLLEEGRVTDRGRPVAKNLRVQPGQVLEVTLPCLLPKRKQRQSDEFLLDPLYFVLDQYAREHPLPYYRDCVVCFAQVYDRALPDRRIRDYDNLSEKQLLDLLSSFVMADDTGLLCDAYNTAELGDQDCTKIYIMEKQRFPQWLTEHKTSLKSISDF